ncbi:MAG: DUF302 domain-containing protein [Calditrichaeota bacterium]|nr:DUF302 domain-containing protein [Calditrichota bacterium]
MKIKRIITSHALSMALILFAIGLVRSTPVSAQDWNLQQVKAKGTYSETVARVKKLVAGNGMMILGQVNQGKILSMTGLKLKAVSLFVGNPTMGKKIFSADPGVGIAIPVRINIFEAKDGNTYVNYFKPSTQLAPFKNKAVAMAAKMLDNKLAKLTAMLAK